MQIATIENSVYVTMKNDIALIIIGTLDLYEHQSTFNPDMPLRLFIYLAEEYQKGIEKSEISLYGTRQILLPAPQCIVFYNGKDEMPGAQGVLRVHRGFEKLHGKGRCTKERGSK